MKKFSGVVMGIAVLSLSAALLAGCGNGSSDSAAASSAPASQTAEETPAPTEEVKAEETPAATEEAKATETPEAPAEPAKDVKKEEPKSDKSEAKTESTAAADAGEITADLAKETALADAGLKESDVVMKKADLDAETDADDIPHFDVDFYANDTSYEYDIDAATGEILSFSNEPMDAEDYAEMEALQNAASGKSGGQEGTSEVTEDKALEIAVSEAGVSMGDITMQKVHLDTDDDTGVTVYEVEFHVGQTEYNFDIDPATGAVLSMESEIDD